MIGLSSIQIDLSSINEGLTLFVDARKPRSLFDAQIDYLEHNEARYQLIEGCFYDYSFNQSGFCFEEFDDQIIQPSIRTRHVGRIAPNIFVGTLNLGVIEIRSQTKVGEVLLEVRSIKTSYREDYRDMLEFITEKSTDLLLRANAPTSHYFEPNYAETSQSLYQRFTFVKSIIATDDFAAAIHRIMVSPITRWSDFSSNEKLFNLKKLTNSIIKQFGKSSERLRLSENHFLHSHHIDSLPKRVVTVYKGESVDTPENRFVKHALEVFLKFCFDIHGKSEINSRLRNESKELIQILESFLGHSVFNEISNPSTLKLNSPVLQRKEGYRELLRVWLMFDLAARLIWKGGDDIYKGGKKDVATLYEYWLFFKLLEILESIFDMQAVGIDDLIKPSENGLDLQLKQGVDKAFMGTYTAGSRKLNIKFTYNRKFNGANDYPNAGSWTSNMRPDYTLSVWPESILAEEDAERQELIVHVHFDAKYSLENFQKLIETDDSLLQTEKEDSRKGFYRRGDLLKMHAYKDAIRRTAGAYVLYPGDILVNQKGFHEIVPGLGAFPIKPSKYEDGTLELKNFISEILEHFLNRTSQREKLAYRIFDIHKEIPTPDNELRELMPEPYGANRSMIPDETFVLVGFYDSKEQYNWICRKRRYNFRMGLETGSLVLDLEVVGAKFLLLHTHGDQATSEIWAITSKGPEVWSKQDLIRNGYPNPSRDYYLVVAIEPVIQKEFLNIKWNFKALKKYMPGYGSAKPFTTNLAELMRNRSV